MQQSQDGVKKDIIKHPLRNIEVTYEAGKTTLTPQDEQLLSTFIRLYDMDLQRKNVSHELHQESVAINENIESLRKELKNVQASFDASSALADKLSAPNYELREASLQKLAQARRQTEVLLKDYNEKILAVYEATKAMQDKLNETNKNDEERVDAMFGELDNVSLDHISNWQNNSIDAAAFDEQVDHFREFRTALESEREVLLKGCEETMDNYINLNQQTTTLFDVWSEFLKRCNLLTALYNLHNDAVGFTEN
jgi:hypothetical protein